MATRKIIQIDEEKCDGCGQCVSACAEGAIQLINGKAKLLSDSYCDGLGACIGECPQDAIKIIEREAPQFDEKAVKEHLAKFPAGKVEPTRIHACPGSNMQMLRPQNRERSTQAVEDSGGYPSQLANWPVQLSLVPIKAPYFEGANLLIAADCVPFSYPDFHRKFLSGRTLIIGCPKLDNVETYRQKLTQIFIQNDVKSVDIAIMEVPCCGGLLQLVKMALEESGKDIPLTLSIIGIRGGINRTMQLSNKRERIL